MTVDAALRLPALRRGAPEVLAGLDRLGRPVRWAHSCEARHVAELLEGDEILLMTGMGLGGAAAEQRAFVRSLVAHRVAALVIELGRVFREMPAALVQEARRHHLPLVALHEEVRFVEVTKQLHSAILTRQLAVERRGAELGAALTGMLVDGAEVPEILGRIAAAIGNPVLLERASGEVVYHAAHEAVADELLADWELLRLRIAAGEEAIAPAAIAPVVVAGGRVWGRLVAVPHERPVDGLAVSAIARSAPLIALALGRGGLGVPLLLESRERGNFLNDVISGAVEPEDVPARAFKLEPLLHGGRMLGVAAAPRSEPAGRDERRAGVAVRAVREGLAARGIASLIGTRPSADDVVALIELPPGMTRSAAIQHAVAAIEAAEVDRPGPTIAVGPLAEGWAEAAATLRLAAETAETMRHGPPRRWHDATVPDVERLLWSLRDDARLADFARRRLAPVLDHDTSRSAALLPTLAALSDHHWHKAPAARALKIQRQSLYARMERLQRLLDADLDDPETRLGLDLAVRALRVLDSTGV